MLAEYRSCPFAAFAGRCERRAERGGARLLGFIMAAILIADAAPASAATVTGPAHVVDGDTLEMEGQRIRLFAIDAPEGDQLCYREAENWPCGQVAADKLGSMIGSSELICRGEEIDQYGRLLAVCMIAGLDLNRLMVAEGWALAFRRYSDIYSGDEAQAQAARLGMWGSTFVSPEEHRAARLEPAPSASSQPQSRRSAAVGSSGSGCLIKGNHSRRGEWIYHLPGSRYFEQTHAEEMFCCEAEAQAAGYRRSRAE